MAPERWLAMPGVKTLLWVNSTSLVIAKKAWVWLDSALLGKQLMLGIAFRGYPMGVDKYDMEWTKQEGNSHFWTNKWARNKAIKRILKQAESTVAKTRNLSNKEKRSFTRQEND